MVKVEYLVIGNLVWGSMYESTLNTNLSLLLCKLWTHNKGGTISVTKHAPLLKKRGMNAVEWHNVTFTNEMLGFRPMCGYSMDRPVTFTPV